MWTKLYEKSLDLILMQGIFLFGTKDVRNTLITRMSTSRSFIYQEYKRGIGNKLLLLNEIEAQSKKKLCIKLKDN